MTALLHCKYAIIKIDFQVIGGTVSHTLSFISTSKKFISHYCVNVHPQIRTFVSYLFLNNENLFYKLSYLSSPRGNSSSVIKPSDGRIAEPSKRFRGLNSWPNVMLDGISRPRNAATSNDGGGIITAVTIKAAIILIHTSSRKTVINLNNDVSRTGLRITMEIPVCSKYGATKSITSSRSEYIFNAVTAKSVSPLTKSPTIPSHSPVSGSRSPNLPFVGEINSYSKFIFSDNIAIISLQKPSQIGFPK
uniref:Uncharacterized protein n=1 Tax=Glossina palpalis gambiensis TaxID=67801 RepID=A0A1B0AQH2_9MUSC